MTNIYQEAIEKMNKKDIDHYCSNLYLKVNEISKNIIDNYEFKAAVSTFIDDIDKEEWYDIPFGYMNEYIKEI